MESLALMPKYEAYKDSGVEWLEQIPNDWLMSRLKFLVSIKTGEKDTAHRVDDGIYPFFIRSPKVQRIDSYSFDGEAILTAGDGDIGKIFHYINGKFDYHQRVYKFSDFRRVKGRYLYYYLQHNLAEEVVKLSAKTTVDSLRLPYLQNFVVTIPSRQEQRLIANFLDKKTTQIDEAIAIKEQQIKLLQERKQIIIQKAVTQGLDPNAPMKDSGVDWIGKIPAHWEIRRAKYIFKKENRRVRPEDGVITCFRNGQVTLRTNRRTEGFTFATKEHGYQGIRKGDLVIHAMDAFAGAIGVSDSDGKSSPVYSVCTSLSGIDVNPKYYALYLRNLALGGFIESLAKGIRERSTDFRYKDFSELFFPLPERVTQDEVVLEIEKRHHEVDEGIGFLTRQIDNLKEYKTTLINSAVTGKIKITPEMITK